MAPRSPLVCVALLCLATGLAVLAAAPTACAQWHALATHRSPALASRLRRVGLTPAPSARHDVFDAHAKAFNRKLPGSLPLADSPQAPPTALSLGRVAAAAAAAAAGAALWGRRAPPGRGAAASRHYAVLNVIGEPFDSDDDRMAAIKRVYLDPDVFVLDVRTPEEVAATGTLRKAVVLPHTELLKEEVQEQLPPYKDTPILVFCKSGYRSGIAEQILVELEYFDVLNGGGYTDIAFLDLYALYKDKQTVVLDVRTPDEVAAGTLARARNIEYQLLPDFAEDLPRDRATLLERLGYTNVTNAGGYLSLKSFDE